MCRVLDENQKPVEQLWNDTLVYYSGYASHQLVDVVAQLCGLIIKSETSKFQVPRFRFCIHYLDLLNRSQLDLLRSFWNSHVPKPSCVCSKQI